MPVGASASLRVQLLGPVRVWRAEKELDLGSPGRRSVFAILALHANRPVSREELVDGLWGEEPPAKAVGVLYTYISGLRRVLEPAPGKRGSASVLASVDSGYSLRVNPDDIDSQRFDRQNDIAQRYWESGNLPAASAAFDDALSLWHGEPLAGLTAPFVELQRGRLDELRLTALESRSELRIAMDDYADTVADLTNLVREHPLRERPRALLMTALCQSGRRTEALDVYAALEKLLATEVGIEPGPTLRRIHQRILANEHVRAQDTDPRAGPRREAPPVPALVPDGATVPPPPDFFVGRDRELALLRATLAGLAEGRGGCVWVEGEPGIGKSALLATALAGVDITGYRVLWFASDELARYLAPWVRADDLDPRTAMVDRLLQLIAESCERRPLIVVVDDLQWADDAGLLAWSRSARRTQQLPFVLLGACRTLPHAAELEQPRNAVSASGGRILTVGPLGSAEIAEFTAGSVDAPTGAALGDFLTAAAGNPSAIRALLDALIQADALRRDADVVDLDPESSVDQWDALTTVVLRYLDVLSATTKDALHWAALLGTEFDLGDLAVIMHRSPTDLVRAVEEAMATGVLVDAEGGLAFRNPAVRRTVYEQRSLAVRTALHREAAEALATVGAPVERIAGQLLAAAPTYDTWTIRWLLDNIDTVATRDPVAAVDLLEFAAASPSITDDDRDALAVRRVRWLFRLGRRPAADARTVLATTHNVEYAAEMRLLLAHLTYRGGDVAGAIASLRRAEQDPSVPDCWRARCQTVRARFERIGLGDLDSAERTAIDALSQQVADRRATATALQELWYAETVRRDHVAGLAHIDKALAVVVGDPDLAEWQLDLLDNRTFSLQSLDRLAEATETLTWTRVLATRMRRPVGRPHVATAVHYYWLGRWDDALAELDLVAEDGPDAGYFDLRIQAPLLQHGVAALIAAHRGDRDALRAHLHAADAYPVTSVGDQENSDFLVVAHAIEAGQRVDARAELAALAPLLNVNYGRATLRHQWLPELVQLALDVGDRAQARAALDICRREAQQESTPARAHAALRRCQALVDGDPKPLLATAHYYGRIGRQVEMATTLADAAVVLARDGQLERARLTLDDALVIFDGLGAAFDVSRLETRMRRHGLHQTLTISGRPTVAGWRSLSGIERLIAEMVADEKTNVDIATTLALSRRTVQQHLSRIMQKLAAQSRAELVTTIVAALAGQPHRPDGDWGMTN